MKVPLPGNAGGEATVQSHGNITMRGSRNAYPPIQMGLIK